MAVAVKDNLLLDVGGTFIKCSDGRSVPVDSSGDRDSIAASLKEAAGDLRGVKKIGVSIPGPFDYSEGIFLMRHKFRSVYGEKFADLVGAADTAEFRFAHDVNCALLGEVARGAGKGFENVAMVSIGTGLGFSMCVSGRILKNGAGSPAVSIYNRPYGLSVLEDYVSKRGILRLYGECGGVSAKELTVREISEKARTGDKAAADAFAKAGGIIAEAVAPILEEYGIGCLLFGGQISRSFDLMEASVLQKLSGVPRLEKISPVSDFDRAAFNGLETIFTQHTTMQHK